MSEGWVVDLIDMHHGDYEGLAKTLEMFGQGDGIPTINFTI